MELEMCFSRIRNPKGDYVMDIKQFEQQLESLRSSQNPSELLNTIFDFLSKNPSWEEREILEMWLMTYSVADSDRVALYWKSQLESGSTIRQKKIVTFLTVLAKRNTVARDILRNYLKTVDSDQDPSWKDLKERFHDIDS